MSNGEVSHVVGAIIMFAIAVILVAVIATFAMGLVGEIDDSEPIDKDAICEDRFGIKWEHDYGHDERINETHVAFDCEYPDRYGDKPNERVVVRNERQ